MAGLGDTYRLKAVELFAKAEQNERLSKEFENLAWAFVRLAEQADRNGQMYQGQQQPKDKAKD